MRIGIFLFLFVLTTLVDFDALGIYPDELVDAQNAVSLLQQDGMRTQIAEYNKLSLFGLELPIYGIKPYNGAPLSYLMAGAFAIFGISISTIKWVSIGLISLSLLITYRILRIFTTENVALLLLVMCAWDPFWLHYARFDHGPLRVTLLLYCLFTYLYLRAIYVEKVSFSTRLMLGLLAGIGFYNHAVFIIPLAAFALLLLLLPRFRLNLFPTINAIVIFFGMALIGVIPLLFDLRGYLSGYLDLISNVIHNRSSFGGRIPFPEQGLIAQAFWRFGTFVWDRTTAGFIFEFGNAPRMFSHTWGFVTLGIIVFGLFNLTMLSKERWQWNSRGNVVSLSFLLSMFLCLVLPLIASFHHMVPLQLSLTFLAALLSSEALEFGRKLLTERRAVWLYVIATTLILALSTVSVAEYLVTTRLIKPSGRFSAAIRDMDYVLGEKYGDKRVLTLGWGSHSYVAMLFSGKRESKIFSAPDQFRDDVVLFVQLARDGTILDSKQRKNAESITDFAMAQGLKIKDVSYSSARGGYRPFAAVVFDVDIKDEVERLAGIILNLRDKLNDPAGSLSNDLIGRMITHRWGGGVIERAPGGVGTYLLLSHVPEQECVRLISRLPPEINTRVGRFDRIIQGGENPSNVLPHCKTGNIWIMFQ